MTALQVLDFCTLSWLAWILLLPLTLYAISYHPPTEKRPVSSPTAAAPVAPVASSLPVSLAPHLDAATAAAAQVATAKQAHVDAQAALVAKVQALHAAIDDFFGTQSPIESKLDRVLALLGTGKSGETIMALLDALTAQVAQNTSLEQSAITLIQGLAAQLQAAAGDPVQVQALASQLQTSASALAAAITANTPATPAPASTQVPATPVAAAGS